MKSLAVPESVLRKRKAVEKLRARAEQEAVEKKQVSEQKKKETFKRAEQYVKEYRDMERETIRLRREARTTGNYYVEPESKLAFVVRIKGINKVAPKPRKILQLLRLLQIGNGVFVRLNKASQQMLRLIEPYVAYGYPNLKSIRELVYKRGFGKVNGQRIPLTENSIIEESLGKYNIICMEDLIHEIVTVGPHFKEANNFLWPFKLNTPRGGFNARKTIHFIEGGDTGNREDLINELIRKMN